MKKETIKEVTERLFPIRFCKGENGYPDVEDYYESERLRFIEGAKWQAEQDKNKFSEEEVFRLTLDALDLGMTIRQDQLKGYSEKSGKELHKEWFDQFKK